MARMLSDLKGQRVDRVCFDFGIVFGTDGGYELRIETVLTLQTASSESIIDPEQAGPAAGQLVGLLHSTIESVEIGASGRLVVSFPEHTTVAVPAHSKYEAWTLTGPDGEGIVCAPGGSLTVWSPTQPRTRLKDPDGGSEDQGRS